MTKDEKLKIILHELQMQTTDCIERLQDHRDTKMCAKEMEIVVRLNKIKINSLMRNIEYLMISESALDCLMSDTITFLMLVFFGYVNYAFFGNGIFGTIICIIGFLVFVNSKRNEKIKHFNGEQEVIDYLNKNDN